MKTMLIPKKTFPRNLQKKVLNQVKAKYLEIVGRAQPPDQQKQGGQWLSWITLQIPMNCKVTQDNHQYFCEYKNSG